MMARMKSSPNQTEKAARIFLMLVDCLCKIRDGYLPLIAWPVAAQSLQLHHLKLVLPIVPMAQTWPIQLLHIVLMTQKEENTRIIFPQLEVHFQDCHSRNLKRHRFVSLVARCDSLNSTNYWHSYCLDQETFEMKLLLGNEEPLSSKDKVEEAAHETSFINIEAASRTTRGEDLSTVSVQFLLNVHNV